MCSLGLNDVYDVAVFLAGGEYVFTKCIRAVGGSSTSGNLGLFTGCGNS